MPRKTAALLNSLSDSSFVIHKHDESRGARKSMQELQEAQQAVKDARVRDERYNVTDNPSEEVLSQVEFLRLMGLFKLRYRIRGGTDLTTAFFDLVRDNVPQQLTAVTFKPLDGVRSPSPENKDDMARESWLLGNPSLIIQTSPKLTLPQRRGLEIQAALWLDGSRGANERTRRAHHRR